MSRSRAENDKILTADFVVMCTTTLTVFGASHILLPVLPLYVLHLGGNEADIGWVIASFNITTLLMRLWGGKWSERFGPARVMRFASALLTVGIALYNFAATIWVLVVTRLVHGLGHGACLTSASSLVAYMAPPARRSQAMGIYLVSGNFAMAIGPAIGLWLALSWGYNNLFMAITVVMVVSFAATQFVDKRNKYTSPERTEGKLFNRDAWLPALVGVTVYFTYGALASYLAPYALQKQMDNPGLFFTAYAISAFVVRVFGGELLDRTGRFKVIVPSAMAICLSMFWLTLASGGWSIIGAGALYGLGSGALFPVLLAYSVDMVDPRERSSAVGTFLAAQDLGQALGAFVSGVVVAYLPLQAVWAVAGATALFGIAAFVVVGRRQEPKSATAA